MAQVKFRRISGKTIDQVSVVDGQILFLVDSKELYMGTSTGWVKFGDGDNDPNVIEHIKLNGTVLTVGDNKTVDLGEIATSTALTDLGSRVGNLETLAGEIPSTATAENLVDYAEEVAAAAQTAAENKHTTLTEKATDYVKVTKGSNAAGGENYVIDDASLVTKIGNMDTATAAAKSAADAAQADVDALETLVGTIPAGATATTVTGYAKELADAAQAAATYDDTALAARVTANETAINTLNGDSTTNGSVAKAVADGIASVVASAPADFDTLKEVADWIANDTTGAAKMQSDIATLKGSDTTEGSVAKAVKDAKTTIDAYTVNGKAINTNPSLDAADVVMDDSVAVANQVTVKSAIEALQTAVGTGGSVDTKIANAIADLDADVTSTNGTNVQVEVVEVDGEITAVNVTDNTASAANLTTEVTRAQAAEGEIASKIGLTGGETARAWTPTTNYGGATVAANMSAIDTQVKANTDALTWIEA